MAEQVAGDGVVDAQTWEGSIGRRVVAGLLALGSLSGAFPSGQAVAAEQNGGGNAYGATGADTIPGDVGVGIVVENGGVILKMAVGQEAPPICPPPALGPSEIMQDISFTDTGKGYWLFSDLGKVYPCGDAIHRGEVDFSLNGPIVGSTVTLDGEGYTMLASDGGIFNFNSIFHGSLPDRLGDLSRLANIKDIAATGNGYVLADASGKTWSFGDAHELVVPGSGGKSLNEVVTRLNKPIVGSVPLFDAERRDYGAILVASDGGVFVLESVAKPGEEPMQKPQFLGSLGDVAIPNPIVALATREDGKGYWAVDSEGITYPFGEAPDIEPGSGAPDLEPPISEDGINYAPDPNKKVSATGLCYLGTPGVVAMVKLTPEDQRKIVIGTEHNGPITTLFSAHVIVTGLDGVTHKMYLSQNGVFERVGTHYDTQGNAYMPLRLAFTSSNTDSVANFSEATGTLQPFVSQNPTNPNIVMELPVDSFRVSCSNPRQYDEYPFIFDPETFLDQSLRYDN